MSNEADILVVGRVGKFSMIAARRSEANRHVIDELVLPRDIAIEPEEGDEEMPQHPMVLFRCFSSVEMVLSPPRLRAMAQWFADAADWLEEEIEEDL